MLSKSSNGASGDKDKIPVASAHELQEELRAFKAALSVPETEHTWQAIDRAVKRYTAVTRGGGCRYEDEYLAGLKDRELARAIVSCVSTERTQLSASTLVFLSAATRLGHSFAPLINIYLPHLLRLLSRTNKLYIARATSCLLAIIRNTRLASVIPFLREGMDEKSVSHRKGCLIGILAALGEEDGFEPVSQGLMVDKELVQKRYLDDLEKCIKIGATDRDIEIRKIAKRAWIIYRREFSFRIQSFATPLSPITRKYLELPPPGQAIPAFPSTTVGSAVASTAAPPTRPFSRPPMMHQVVRPAAPPRAPSPVKARPASRTAVTAGPSDLGRSTSSLASSTSSSRRVERQAPVQPQSHAQQQQQQQQQQQTLPKTASRPPSRQALPQGYAPPAQLQRSVSASGSLQHSQQHALSSSQRGIQTLNAELPAVSAAAIVPTFAQPSAANGSRLWAAATASLSRDTEVAPQTGDIAGPSVAPTGKYSRPPSREASAAAPPAFRPGGPRRVMSANMHQRQASASNPEAAPVQHRLGPQRAPRTASAEQEDEVQNPLEQPQLEEAVVPQKRPASAMSTNSAVGVGIALVPRRERTPPLFPPAEIGAQTYEQVRDTAAPTVGEQLPVVPSAVEIAQSTEAVADLVAPFAEMDGPASAPEDGIAPAISSPGEPINPLSVSCPPSTSTFSPQPPPPAVDLAALAAKLPPALSTSAGPSRPVRQAFRPARPNLSAGAQAQVRRVPSSLSVKQQQQQRSVSASAASAAPPSDKEKSKASVSLKDTLANGRAQAQAAKADAHAHPPAKKQALSSSTSSSSGAAADAGRNALSSSASSRHPAGPKAAPAPKTQARGPAFKPYSSGPSAASTGAAPSVKPPRPQGSIFDRLAAPTASSAARARAVSGGSGPNASVRAGQKPKETFKKPALPGSRPLPLATIQKTALTSVVEAKQVQHFAPLEAPIVVPRRIEQPLAEPEQAPQEKALPAEQINAPETEAVPPDPNTEAISEAANTTFQQATQLPLPDTPVSTEDPPVASDADELPAAITSAPRDEELRDQRAQSPIRQRVHAVSSALPIAASAYVDQESSSIAPVGNTDAFEQAQSSGRPRQEQDESDAVPEAEDAQVEAPASQQEVGHAPVVASLDNLESLLAATIDSLSLGTSETISSGAAAVPDQSASPVTEQQDPLESDIFATARKAEHPPVGLVPDPSLSILFSPTKGTVADPLMLEDEPSGLAGDDTVIERESSPVLPAGQADVADPAEADTTAEEPEEVGGGDEEEEDDVALLISRELSDDSLEELASRFESSRLFANPTMDDEEDAEEGWNGEDIENTPVRPRLLTKSWGPGSVPGSDEEGEGEEDATEVLSMTAGKKQSQHTARSEGILPGMLSKTPMPVRAGQASALDERDVLRTM